MEKLPYDDGSAEAMAAHVEEAAIEASWRRPDSICIQRAGWMQIITPSSPFPVLNSVMRSILSDAEADAVIDRTFADYRARGLPFRWLVGESSRPHDLAARLVARGLVRGADSLRMTADVVGLDVRPARDITLEDLRIETVDEWLDASASGWEMSGDAIENLRIDVEHQLRNEHHRIRHVLARCDGVPAGAGAICFVKDGGYLVGTSVVPRFRSRGVYRSLVAYRLMAIRERGLRRVLTSAIADTSAPICARLGFRTVSRTTLYTSPVDAE